MGDLATFFEDDFLTSSDDEQPVGDSDPNESVWQHKKVKTSNVTFSNTSVDEELMAVAKEEVAAVSAKVRRVMGKEHPDLSDCVNYFLNGVKLMTKLLKLWFMKPVRSPGMKVGSANEVHISTALSSWMDIYGSGWSVANGEIVHRGLLQSREVPVLATSIDGATVLHRVVDDVVVSSLVCVIEFKTATENSTEREARSRLQSARDIVGDSNCRMFEFDARSPLFKTTVWTAAYRGQLLHHCATTTCNTALFVNASGQTIVYAALVSFSPECLQQYQAMIARLDAELQPLLTERALASYPPHVFGHAVDASTFTLWRDLASAILKRREEGQALPPLHDVVPHVVSMWNHCKGGQDVVSRQLKNVKVDFRSLTPRGFINVRFIMSSLLNAHMLHRLLLNSDMCSDFSSYHKWKAFLNYQKSFSDFLCDVATHWVPSQRMTSGELVVGEACIARPSGLDPPRVPRYNKLGFFNRADMATFRLTISNDLTHWSGSGPSRSCVVCGGRTTSYCQSCTVNLCSTKHSRNQKTCYELFHSSRTIRRREEPAQSSRRGRKRSIGSV
ncbi:SAP domain-containing protein [Plasmodiophora brassicae]